MSLKYRVEKQLLRAVGCMRPVVELSRNLVFLELEFDAEWDGAAITVLFSNDFVENGKAYQKIWNKEPVPVPTEVLETGMLRIGCVGLLDGGETRITTARMERGVQILQCGGILGVDPAGQTPELWEQILASMGQLGDLQTEDKSSLVAAINEVLQSGGTGSVDPADIAQAVEDYMAENPIQETDPTVPAWAKAPEKPTYTAAEVHALPDTYTPPVDTVLSEISTNPVQNKIVTAKLYEVEAIAKGRNTGHVFDTVEAMQEFIADHADALSIGDNLYIRATDVPDYWWDGTAAQPLETQKVDLTEYAKKSEVPAIDPTVTKSGQAADAAVVREELNSLSSKIESIPSAGSGLSIAERTTLIAVVNAIGAFNINNGQELIDNFNAAWGNVVEEIPATGITLSAVSLNFTAGTSQTLTATVEPSDSTDAVIWSSSNPSVATVSNGVVTPVANGDCIITATAGSVSASCSVNVAFAEEVVYYTITKNLKNCTSDNSAESVVEGGGYSATLTADDGYTLDGASVSIVINGEDITDTAYANGVITIQSVTGDVIITVTAVEAGSGDGEEIDVLSNIGFDGTSYLDTEFVPESIYNRYVFGVMTEKTEDSTFKYFAGVSMRDNTSLTDSNYIDFIFGTYGGKNAYNSEMPNARFYVSIAGVGPNGIFTGADKGDGESSQPYSMPFYISVADGAQALWLDEDCTIAPTAGYFQDISGTVSFSGSQYYSEEKMPVMSMWLGGVRITGIMSNQYKNWGSGVKFYCFKVYDGDGNLIVNMRPAKQGSIIGMWDNVRNKFYPATENGGTVSYEEVA